MQAARALNTQARILIELSAGQETLKRLGVAATSLQTYLQTAARQGAPLTRPQVETYASNVMLAAPDKVRPQAA